MLWSSESSCNRSTLDGKIEKISEIVKANGKEFKKKSLSEIKKGGRCLGVSYGTSEEHGTDPFPIHYSETPSHPVLKYNSQLIQ